MLALALVVVLNGRVLDRTTGQPLVGVEVSTGGRHARTDAKGRYALRNLRPGRYTLTLQSHDVPAQTFRVTVRAPATRFDMRACSTTLDYGCGRPLAPTGGGETG